MPQLMNIRFDEINGRLNLLDRQASLLLRDLRDIRAGVTRQLIAQDQEIAIIKTDIATLNTFVAGEVGTLKEMLIEVLSRLPQA